MYEEIANGTIIFGRITAMALQSKPTKILTRVTIFFGAIHRREQLDIYWMLKTLQSKIFEI